MPVGICINSLSIVFGGVIGATMGHKLKENFKTQLSMIFGVCAIGMGISSIVLMVNMPAVILAVILGTAAGLAISLGKKIEKCAVYIQKPIDFFLKNKESNQSEEQMAMMLTAIVLFCASGTGIYGSIDSGMTGNHTILIAKSVLDFFTALIFACQLGAAVSVIAVPQFTIFLILFLLAKIIFPMTTPNMINDFKACGGFLLVATGFRMMKLRELPIADMILAMVFVMPFSFIWTNWIAPFL